MSSPNRQKHLSLWFWSIAAMTFAVLVIGGITRLTRSGLSIVDWQPVMGIVPPLNEAQWTDAFDRYRQFPEYQQLRRDMTLAEFKSIFFWEYLHRLAARAIGVLFVVPFIVFWRKRYFTRPMAAGALALFGLGAMQGVMGWLMVKSGLVNRPSVSHYRLAAHLVLGITIVGFATWLARDAAIGSPRPARSSRRRGAMRPGVLIVGAILAMQIVWGAFVAGTHAGLVSSTFPLMAGKLIPDGLTALEPWLLNVVENQLTVQWLHRVLGTLLLIAAATVFVQLRPIADRATQQFSAILLALIASQYALGVLTVITYVPLPLAAAHQALAVAIAAVWVALAHQLWNLDLSRRGSR